MVIITNPIIVNVDGSAVIECSAFTATAVANPNSIILRSEGGVVFTDDRIIISTDDRVKTYTFRDIRISDNGLMLQCAFSEHVSPVVTLQVNCEYHTDWR